eukprot:TRINITY_DN8285_c0_g1_i1.p3 TRINITY_DN8285_c0_g1~~TRINITY_DN8285_c0_g1_i1.p3  ORF type:complete len:105 (-),score=20.61 TRINITY_DN8285_c0_g1_i1:54-368(-)
MHFVFPEYGLEEIEDYQKKMEACFKDCLLQANKNEVQSLTIPIQNSEQSKILNQNCLKALAGALNKFLGELENNQHLIYLRILVVNEENMEEVKKGFEHIKNVL